MARPKTKFLYEVGDRITTKYADLEIIDRLSRKRETSDINNKIYVCKCLSCGEKQENLQHTIESGLGHCNACSDCRSFGERFFYWFLKQMEIDFDVEYSPVWIGRKRYDFHFVKNNVDYIVEIDGAQHTKRYGHRRLSHEEIVQIDSEKEEIAREHGHIIIRIDCVESKGKCITKSIENSILSEIFDLSSVDWSNCFYMALSSKAKQACSLWNSGHKSTKEISEITGNNQNYIAKFLVDCASYGLCDYNSEDEQYKGSLQSTNGKKVICLDNRKIYKSASECSRQSEEDFGTYFNGGGITRVCRKERKQYKGFHFEFAED